MSENLELKDVMNAVIEAKETSQEDIKTMGNSIKDLSGDIENVKGTVVSNYKELNSKLAEIEATASNPLSHSAKEESANNSLYSAIKDVADTAERKSVDVELKALGPNVDGAAKGGAEDMAMLERTLREGNVLRQIARVTSTNGSTYIRPILTGGAGC